MKDIFILFLLAILIISCSSPLDKPFKKDKLEEDIISIKESLSEDEFEILIGYITLKSFGDDKMLGKTYGSLLEEAKKLRIEMMKKEEEEKILAKQAKIEEAERIKRLGEALTVSLFDKGFTKYDYQDYNTYKFIFENKTDKNIKAFTGQIFFTDLFDKEISNLSLTYDDGIKAKSTKKWNAQTDYNQFKDEHVSLKNKDIEDLKVNWVPKKIIFSDNSTLE